MNDTVLPNKDKQLGPINKAEPGSAGLETDWANSQIVFRAKNPQASTKEALAQVSVGWPVKLVEVQYSQSDLEGVQAKIEKAYPEDLFKIGIDVQGNLLEVKTRSRSVADKINAQYGDEVAASVGTLVEDYDGTAANCSNRYNCDPPIRGGATIRRDGDGAPCTTAFVILNAMQNDGLNHGAMVTTAGHCFRFGDASWHTGQGHMGTAYDHYGDQSGTVDADVMFINIADTEDSNDVIDHSQSGNDYVIDITSTSCAAELSSTCGESVGDPRIVSASWSDIKFSTTIRQINITVFGNATTGGGTVTKRHSREMYGNPFTGGDSGSPVYSGHSAAGVFFGGCRAADGCGSTGYSYYSHIRWAVSDATCGTECHVKTSN